MNIGEKLAEKLACPFSALSVIAIVSTADLSSICYIVLCFVEGSKGVLKKNGVLKIINSYKK